MIVSCHMSLGWGSGDFSHFCLFLDLIIIVEEHKWLHAGPCFHCQVVGEVVIHLAASLILLWGGFPCQEAPAWPPAHQPYLAPAYWRPTAHALALRVGGRAGWQALAQIHFGKSCCPHTCEWSADFSAEHKRPQDSISSSCGMQAHTEMLASIWLETVAAFWQSCRVLTNIYVCLLLQSSVINPEMHQASLALQPVLKAVK